MNYERIPDEVYVISALYRPRDEAAYRSFMVSALRQDDEYWLHIEYTAEGASRTLAGLQNSLQRMERHLWQWPDRIHTVAAETLVEMASQAPVEMPSVVGYVHDLREVQWPKGRGEFVLGERVAVESAEPRLSVMHT